MLCRLNMGLCQEYLTLEQLKQQTPSRWVETYQDKYGRNMDVDIDIQVYGDAYATIYKLNFPYGQEIRYSNNNPYNSVEKRWKKNSYIYFIWRKNRCKLSIWGRL